MLAYAHFHFGGRRSSALPVSLYRLKGLVASYNIDQTCIILCMKKTIRRICILVSVLALSFLLAACVPSQTGSSSTPASPQTVESSSESSQSSNTGSDSWQKIENSSASNDAEVPNNISVQRNGTYTDKDHVALYIHTYGTVPSNYISKSKARKAGWVNTKGNLWDVLPGMSIGGGGYYNDDKMLPDAPGREWFECDIDYNGGFRNAKRIVYSDDGLIFYTSDHYKTFERLY